MQKKYTMGIDFGSLSARAVLVDIKNGLVAGEYVSAYAHGVLDSFLPATREPLPPASALQLPDDYLAALSESVKGVLSLTNVPNEDIIGIAVDFTSCTLLAVDENAEPLCNKEAFRGNIHAYAKMWKQHTAFAEAEEITRVAAERGESFLKRYGSKILSEWAMPKILETLRKAPDVYAAAYRFIEAGDWINAKLTGKMTMNYCMAGLKFLWSPTDGYPDETYFEAVDPALKHVVSEKLVPESEIYPLDACIGVISEEGAKLTGLRQGTPVAPARIDAHTAASAVGANSPGRLLMAIGTGMGMTLLSKKEIFYDGMCGVSFGAVIPQYYGYEAGLSGCGDIFDWCARTCSNAALEKQAADSKVPVIQILTEKAAKLRAGESGLLAVDWWNGNRSVLADTDLSGMLFGMTLQTQPEEIFRAILEATGFSARMVVDSFIENGINVDVIYAVGGIAQKNILLMQIFADIMNREIIVPDVEQACAVGSAIFAAVAAGSVRGGYDTLDEAIEVMRCTTGIHYHPVPENVKQYEILFKEFKVLHDYFGRGENTLLKILSAMRLSCK